VGIVVQVVNIYKSEGNVAEMNFEKLREKFLFAQTKRTESKVRPFICMFHPSDVVLDVGCGAGIELKELGNLVCMCVGVDIDERVLQLAKRNTQHIKTV